MVTRSLDLSGGGATLNLDGAPVFALPGFGGGLPGTDVQWLVAAGDGSIFRGARATAREFPLPLHLSGGADQIRATLDTLSQILEGQATLTMTLDDGTTADQWDLTVVRTDGGGFDWSHQAATDALDLPLTLTAGDPYWTRRTTETVTIADVTAAQAITVPGTADSPAVWTVTGPCTGFTLTSPAGRSVQYTDALAAGETVTVDMGTGIVTKAGANAYGSLGPVPRFWSMTPGTSTYTATMTGSGTGSAITATYHPRRKLVY